MQSSVATQPKRILVVDDDPDIRNVLRRFLAGFGYQVDTAADGEEGLEMLQRDPPDVVLLDFDMPKLNGIEVLRRIEQDGLAIGVIMISGAADEETAKGLLEMGAADYISKPFNFPYLATSLVSKLMIGA